MILLIILILITIAALIWCLTGNYDFEEFVPKFIATLIIVGCVGWLLIGILFDTKTICYDTKSSIEINRTEYEVYISNGIVECSYDDVKSYKTINKKDYVFIYYERYNMYNNVIKRGIYVKYLKE